jgi:hypothetical protein
VKKHIFIIIIVLTSIAQAQHRDAGTVAFPFLTMGYDARAMSMGGAANAMPNDIYGVLSNPAALGYVDRLQIMGGYRQVIMDVWGGPLGMACPTRHGVFAPHLISLTSGEFDEVNEFGLETGQRAVSSYTALGVSWARVLRDNVAVGATVKGAYHYIGVGGESYSADGFAVDCGVQYRAGNGRLIYGASLRNWGFVRSGYLGGWNEYEFPYGIEAGVSYTPRHMRNLRVALDVNKFNGDYANFEPALEYTVIAKTLFLRGGYAVSFMDFEKTLDVFRGERDETYQKSGLNTLSLGIGVESEMDDVEIKLDAAIQFNSDLSGPSVVVSLIVVF